MIHYYFPIRPGLKLTQLLLLLPMTPGRRPLHSAGMPKHLPASITTVKPPEVVEQLLEFFTVKV